MKRKFLQIIAFTFSLFIFGVGSVIVYPEKIGLCIDGDRECIFSYPVFEIGEPLSIFSVFLIASTFLLLFSSIRIFLSWLKFATFAIPLVAIWIFTTPVNTGGWVITPADRGEVAWFAGILFFIGSLIVIGWKWWKLRKEKTALKV
jgi:hypothetical protein